MKKRMRIGGDLIEVEYNETYRPETIKIDGTEYSMELYAEQNNGKNWRATAGGNILYYACESGKSYGIPQSRFTETSEAQKRAQKKYDEANKDKWRMIHLKLNKDTDADIIEALEQSGNIQGYIKDLIRKASK